MFTGIVEETGIVKNFSNLTNFAELTVECKKVLDGTNLGDSIAVNGVCQTVVEISRELFKMQLSAETLAVTNLKNLTPGQIVNLERALTPNTRLGGHIVSGHVDCCGKLLNIEKYSDFYNIEFEIPKNFVKYVVNKGSITINGISLTVAKISDNRITIAVIPHTFENTNLSSTNPGDFVNVETDIFAKYVEKILSAKDNNDGSIDMKFLQENGFV